ncbi:MULTISPECIES: GNAT family N-acetyltransferase [Hyphobacterium]|uniref:GNAT family N-acetyltransferase n=1 Tax=Hyphobacterium vulgare TaxID=1736751 RepID=A0ABV6ZTR0_9PROT
MTERMIQTELKRPSELTDAERGAWLEFVDGSGLFDSPYFRLEFAECCEEARGDTRVLVGRKCGQILGFLPLQLGKVGYARPLSGPLSDVHGVITRQPEEVCLPDWLKSAGIPLFEYHSALALQPCWHESEQVRDGSAVVDCSDGYDAFEEDRKTAEPKAFKNIRARRRKLEAEEGGFEFRMDDFTGEAFDAMLHWKRAQYHTTGVFDVFSVAWTNRLVHAISRKQTERFAPVCGSLRVNGKIIAAHFGMRSENRVQYWFPSYDPAFNHVSPGLLLLLETIRHAGETGIATVELGPGDYDFKRHLGAWQVPLAGGCVVTRSAVTALRSAARALAAASERAPIGRAGGIPRRALKKADRLASFYAV